MTLKGNRHQPVCSRYSEFVRQLTGLCNVSVAFAHDGSADEGSMASIERTNPLHVFSSTFSFVYSRGLVVTITSTPWALFRGDEGVGRRYEANISYGLLGSQHKHSHHRAC